MVFILQNLVKIMNRQMGYDAQTWDSDLIMKKISNFLEMKDIQISDFWKSDRNYASCQDLQNFCDQCGLKLTIHDQINLKTQLFNNRQVVSIYQFCDLIPHWKESGQQVVAEFLKKRSEILVTNLNTKNKQIQRFKSSSNALSRNPSLSANDQKKKRLFSAAANRQQKSYKPNNSRKYLEQHQLKTMKKEKELAKAIEKTKNQYQYSMLLKMNEMNEFSKKNKSSITYRAFKNAEGMIKVRVFDLQVFKKELTIKQFESQYKIFKKSTKENKEWERPVTSKQVQADNTSKPNNVQKNLKKEERQEQLTRLLRNTENLTKVLQQQIRIFKMRGIYGCDSL